MTGPDPTLLDEVRETRRYWQERFSVDDGDDPNDSELRTSEVVELVGVLQRMEAHLAKHWVKGEDV